MKFALPFSAFVAVASATYSCPTSRSVLLCNCRLWDSDYAADTGNMSLCDYEFGQIDCDSHRTRNYCCAGVEDSGFPGRWNGIDCTGAKNVNYLNHEWDIESADNEWGSELDEFDVQGDYEASEADQVDTQVKKIMAQAVLRDSRPGREIVSWELVD